MVLLAFPVIWRWTVTSIVLLWTQISLCSYICFPLYLETIGLFLKPQWWDNKLFIMLGRFDRLSGTHQFQSGHACCLVIFYLRLSGRRTFRLQLAKVVVVGCENGYHWGFDIGLLSDPRMGVAAQKDGNDREGNEEAITIIHFLNKAACPFEYLKSELTPLSSRTAFPPHRGLYINLRSLAISRSVPVSVILRPPLQKSKQIYVSLFDISDRLLIQRCWN